MTKELKPVNKVAAAVMQVIDTLEPLTKEEQVRVIRSAASFYNITEEISD